MPSRPLTTLFALLILAACDRAGGSAQWGGTIDTLESGIEVVRNPAEGIWDSSTAWRLVEEMRIGSVEGEGPETFAQIIDLAVDGLGRVYVLDRQIQEIRVFDPDGSHVRTIGGPGGGPGEFIQADGMDFGPGGRLWVIDNNRPHYAVFDTAGTFVASYPRQVTRYGFGWPGGWTAGGELIDYSSAPHGDGNAAALVRYDTTARAFVDTALLAQPDLESQFFDFRDSRGIGSIAGIPFAPRWHWRLGPTGTVWAGFAGSYLFHEITRNGDTLRAVERPGVSVAVSARERESAIADIREAAGAHAFDASRIPDVKPAFEGIDVDDLGYVWVRRPAPDTASTSYDVFDPGGRLQGTLTGPALQADPYLPLWIRGDALHVVDRDELGVQYVVRYRIENRS